MPHKVFTDQMGRDVEVAIPLQRIISLVPSITELLFDLGLGERVVGVTRFCIHPSTARQKAANIGGTKKLHTDRIRNLHPDLIIGSKEENTKQEITELSEAFPVWMSDVNSVDDGIDLIFKIGEICDRTSEAHKMASEITHDFEILEKSRSKNPLKVVYLIWNNPIMGVGRNTFIHDVIAHCGWHNALADLRIESNFRYPELKTHDLIATNPDLLLLSSEPYPFNEEHIQEFRDMLPHSQVKLVDGELFSWYGSRMKKMPDYLRRLRRELERNHC